MFSVISVCFSVSFRNKVAKSEFLTPVAGLFFETENRTIFLEANFLENDFVYFPKNVGVHAVISPNGSNSLELKKRRKIPRF